MIDEIWPQYGLPAPVGPARPWIIDQARNPPGYAAQVRMTADILAGSGRFISGIVGKLRDSSTPESEEGLTAVPYFCIQTDHDAVEVILDDGTQGLVGSQTDGILWRSGHTAARTTGVPCAWAPCPERNGRGTSPTCEPPSGLNRKWYVLLSAPKVPREHGTCT